LRTGRVDRSQAKRKRRRFELRANFADTLFGVRIGRKTRSATMISPVAQAWIGMLCMTLGTVALAIRSFHIGYPILGAISIVGSLCGIYILVEGVRLRRARRSGANDT
jgi:hypothetical protein